MIVPDRIWQIDSLNLLPLTDKPNNKTMKNLLILSGTILLFLMSCAKDGETGPAGPPGNDGNANVLSITKIIYANDWEAVDVNNTTAFETTVDITELSSKIIESGAVLVYIKSSDQYTVLPFTLYFANGISATYTYAFKVGEIGLMTQYNQLVVGGEPLTNEFKFVLIDGITQSEAKKLPTHDYNAVVELFNIID